MPRLAPGSGCGSVGEQTTLANGVEPQRYYCWVSPLRAGIPHATATPSPGPSPQGGGEHDTTKAEIAARRFPSPGTGEGGGSQAAGWGPRRDARVRDASAKRRDPTAVSLGLASVTHGRIVRYGAAARPRRSRGHAQTPPFTPSSPAFQVGRPPPPSAPRRLIETALTAGLGVPPAAPGSGCGSVTHDKTVRNGGEPRDTACGVSPLRARIPHAGLALAPAGGPLPGPSPASRGGEN